MKSMHLNFEELPPKIQETYRSSVSQLNSAACLGHTAAIVVSYAVAIVDYTDAVIYTTQDEGRTFLVEKIAETIHLGKPYLPSARFSVQRVIRVSDIKPAAG